MSTELKRQKQVHVIKMADRLNEAHAHALSVDLFPILSHSSSHGPRSFLPKAKRSTRRRNLNCYQQRLFKHWKKAKIILVLARFESSKTPLWHTT